MNRFYSNFGIRNPGEKSQQMITSAEEGGYVFGSVC